MENKKFNPIPQYAFIYTLLILPLLVLYFTWPNMPHSECLKTVGISFCISCGISSLVLLNIWYRFTKENQRNGK